MERRLSTPAVALLCLAVLTAPALAQSGPLGLSATGGTAEPGDSVTVTVTLENTGTEPAGGIVTVTDLPAGWTIESHTDDGGIWNAGDRKWLFQTVPADGTVAPSVTLSVPANASGNYEVGANVTGGDGSAAATATVTVSGATATDRSTTGGSGPGFGVTGPVVALVGVALVGLQRR